MSVSFKMSLAAAVSVFALISGAPAVLAQTAPLPELKVEARRAVPSPRVARPAATPRRAARSAPRRQQAARPAPRPVAAAPVVDSGIQATTAGPVRGYQAYTSVSATRTDLPIQNTPQSVVVLPRKVLDDQGVTTISEALLNVSGTVPLNPLFFGQVNPKIRGFSAERVVDGLPVYYDAGGRDLTGNIERIEVLKGPQGVLFTGGMAATSGVINVVSKLPTATRFAEFGMSAGTNRFLSPFFDINQPLSHDGTVLFRITGQYQAEKHNIQVVDTRNFSINPTLVWTNKSGTTLTLQGQYSKREQQDYAGLPAVGTIDRSLFSIPRTLFAGDPNIPKHRSDIASATAKLDHAFNTQWSSSTTLRYSSSTFDEPSQGILTNLPSAGSTFDVYNLKMAFKSQELVFKSTLMGKFEHGPAKSTLLLGVDYNRVHDTGTMPGDFFGTPVNFLTGPFPAYVDPATLYFNWRNRYSIMAATAQVQTSLYDRLHLVAGGRLARFDIVDNDLTGMRALSTGGPNLVKSNETRFLPRIGVAFDVTKNITLFAGYSEGMKPVPFLISPDPMKPELSRQLEAGVKLNTDFGLSATLAAFEVKRANVPVTFGFASVQTGEQRSRGFEADAVYQPNANWSFLGSYAHTDTTVLKDTTAALVGQTLPGVPRNSGRLWANYRITTGDLKGLSFGAGVYAASGVKIELGAPWKTASYATLDAKIAYERNNWKFSLHAKNLTDAKYFTRLEYFSGRVVPGAGRGFYATASAKF